MSINVRQMKNFKLVGNTLDTNKEQSKSNSFLSSKPNSPSKASTPLTNKRAEVILVAKRVSTANRTPNCPEQPPRSTPTQRKSLPEIKQSNELDELKIQQLESENSYQLVRLKELEAKHKLFADLEKQNEELARKLACSLKKENELDEEIGELRKLNDNNYIENGNLKERIIILESNGNETIENLKKEVERLKSENMEELKLKKQLKDDHFAEIKKKDEKLSVLKKQIALSFKDNSWERQLQIDDLTKELKRVQEECVIYKQRLKDSKNGCKNCSVLSQKLEEKTVLAKYREKQLEDLVMIVKKFQTHSNLEKDLISLVNENRNYSEFFPSLKSESKNTFNTKPEPITAVLTKPKLNSGLMKK